jgi:hypothetical protein
MMRVEGQGMSLFQDQSPLSCSGGEGQGTRAWNASRFSPVPIELTLSFWNGIKPCG